jgi:hypothetical protein
MTMKYPITVAAAAALLLCGPALAAPKKASKRPPPAAAAPPPRADEPLSETQHEIAHRVFTGRADCEFAQSVDVEPLAGQPGRFSVVHGKLRYTMSPQETTSGAVRLEDRTRGVVWIQIPAKSMLMDMKAGRRLVDACMHAAQRGATVAAASALGIVPEAAAAAAPPAPVAVGSPGPRDATPVVPL